MSTVEFVPQNIVRIYSPSIVVNEEQRQVLRWQFVGKANAQQLVDSMRVISDQFGGYTVEYKWWKGNIPEHRTIGKFSTEANAEWWISQIRIQE